MIVKLLTEHHLEFLSLKGGFKGSSESAHVKMPHCWKFHARAQLQFCAQKNSLSEPMVHPTVAGDSRQDEGEVCGVLQCMAAANSQSSQAKNMPPR